MPLSYREQRESNVAAEGIRRHNPLTVKVGDGDPVSRGSGRHQQHEVEENSRSHRVLRSFYPLAVICWSLRRLRSLIHPPIHGLVPQAAVLWLQHPVAFIREVQHLRRNLQPLQGGEELKSFRDVETVIELSVND